MKNSLLVFLALGASALAAGELQLKGKIDAVTVYRGQALVTRVVEIKTQAGLQEVVVTDLPQRVIPGTLYAEADEGVEVRSVLYRERPVGQDIREEVRKLDEQIRLTQDKIAAKRRHDEVLAERKAYLAKLENFTAPTATFELTKGVLNADTLQKITSYQFEQRNLIADEELKNGVEVRDLSEQLSVQQRQRNEITGGSARTVREALIFVNLAKAEGRIRVRYLVDLASWTPSYNIRADAKREKVTVEYNASIQQMSGEDWSDVQMTLSTATPSLVARAPIIAPLTVTLAAPVNKQAAFQFQDYAMQREEIVERRNKAQQNRSSNISGNNFSNTIDNNQAAANPPPQQGVQTWNVNNGDFNSAAQAANSKQLDSDLNDIAGELQILDLVTQGKIAKKPEHGKPVISESVSVNYDLTGRSSLPSRSSEQLIQIAALTLKGQFYKVAIPLLTNYVYEEAMLTNEGKFVLLAGPASTFVAQQFVGRGELPTVAIGESFTVGFGIDASLRAERELVEKTEAIQGGNRELGFTYRLQIENFGGEAAAVRVLERLPISKENEVRVTPAVMSVELSKDPLYEKNEHKKGILRWDATVPAQAIGAKAFFLQYQFQLAYDKQMNIIGVQAPPPPNPAAAPMMKK